MNAPLIVGAKLARPSLPPVLNRDRLVTDLVESVPSHPLTLVSAGAGYGKTTLLASFADRYPAGVMWYSLGPEDADFSVFLWHLVAGVGGQSRRFGRSLKTLLQEGGAGTASAEIAAGAFLNDVSGIKGALAIVLDDYHLVSETPAINRFLSTVIENLKAPVRFVIASRNEPPLPLGRLRARRQVREIGPPDLAFTKDELRLLLNDIYARTPSEQALELMADSTEGWVAAVQMVVAAEPQRASFEIPQALRRATQPGSVLYDYLAEEVLNQQPDHLRRWLLKTSIFEELDPETLRTVVGDEHVDDYLHQLSGRRLVLPYEGQQGSVYRYHALLRRFLRRRLRAELPAEEVEALHLLAARVFQDRGDLVGAARQLSLSGNTAKLADFLRDNGLRLVDQGHYQALLSWFEGIPSTLLDDEPLLRLRLGDVRHYLGDLPGAELEYERAQARFREREDVLGEAWATVGLARIWNLRGQSQRAAEEGQAALDRLPAKRGGDVPELKTRLLQVVSGAQFYLGNYTRALELLEQLTALSRGKPERQAAVWNNRAVVWASQGNYQQAAKAFARGLERPGARHSPRASLHLSNLASLHSAMGDNERARTMFSEALELAHRYKNRSQILSCLSGLSRLHYRSGNLDRSLEMLREVEELNSELKVPLIEADSLALRARILTDSGQFAAARSALSQALAAYGAAGRDANWLLYRIEAAVVDLRGGRIQEARQGLSDLHPLALESEALFPRTMLLFYLGEAERRLGEDHALDNLSEALRLGSELGYDAALSSEMRRNFDPFALVLRAGRECDYIARLACALGSASERNLLPLIGEDGLSKEAVRAVLAALAETGGPASHRKLMESSWHDDPLYQRRVSAVLAALQRRHPDVGAAEVPGRGQGLRLDTLGELTLSFDGEEVPRTAWRSQRALSIFVYLAVRGSRGVSKERLIELFWTGKQSARAEKNFHPTVSYVRHALKDLVDGQIILMEDGLYSLDETMRLNVDVHRFEAAVNRASLLESSVDKLRGYQDALALYHGDFLGDRYEPWADELRTQLAFAYENALTAAAGLHFEAGQFGDALGLYNRILERNPYREEIHSKMMMCYHQDGDRRAVREQFDRLKAILRKELDVEPLPETVSLYETLMVSP